MKKNPPNNNEINLTSVDIVVSKSDDEGNIEYANPIFYKLSGYSKKELIFTPHSILRHPDMPSIIFKFLWHELKEGKEVYAFIKNLTKDGSFYWVLAYVRPAFNPDGSLRNYVSTRKFMNLKAKEIIRNLYTELLEIESSKGIEASEEKLLKFLAGQTFNDIMLKIQNH